MAGQKWEKVGYGLDGNLFSDVFRLHLSPGKGWMEKDDTYLEIGYGDKKRILEIKASIFPIGEYFWDGIRKFHFGRGIMASFTDREVKEGIRRAIVETDTQMSLARFYTTKYGAKIIPPGYLSEFNAFFYLGRPVAINIDMNILNILNEEKFEEYAEQGLLENISKNMNILNILCESQFEDSDLPIGLIRIIATAINKTYKDIGEKGSFTTIQQAIQDRKFGLPRKYANAVESLVGKDLPYFLGSLLKGD